MTTVSTDSDANLVAASLSGNRDAFGEIVGRYQSLVCSLAYSATGRLSDSEDLAQEVFITAWKELRNLREPLKLRAWLCGLARNTINNWLRRHGREPSHDAQSLDLIGETTTSDPMPHDSTISREEENIMWRSLERVPDIYRETLVLFYREQQSIQKVATALDLSEDAVKQRLSRGRKLLADEVTGFVEGALKRSAPGRAFTFGVLAALPAFTGSASAATLGAATAHGTAAKTVLAAGVSGAIFGTVLGLLGAWFGVKASLANALSEKERRFIVRCSWAIGGLVTVFLACQFALIRWVVSIASEKPLEAAVAILVFSLAYCAVLLIVILKSNQRLHQLRLEAANEAAHLDEGAQFLPEHFEYRSRWTLLGVPLIHIKTGRQANKRFGPAFGWIAFGDVAVGILFAAGGCSFGAISMGGGSVGILSVGGLAIGGLAFGGVALGGAAIGGAAMGFIALGGVAIAWHGAVGGIAVAHHLAMGGVAQALHANDAVAKAFFETHPFVGFAQGLAEHSKWIVWLCVIPICASIWLAYRARRQRAKREAAADCDDSKRKG